MILRQYVVGTINGILISKAFKTVPFTRLAQEGLSQAADPYHTHYTNMKTFIERLMRFAVASPDSVAKVVVKTMQMRRPPLRMPGTIDASLFSLMRRVLPQRLYYTLLYYGLPNIRKWGPYHED